MTSTRTQATPPVQSTGRLLTALIVGGITAILDTTVVAIGLHTLIDELHTTVATIQWVSSGYLLALALAIPFVSWAQARFGGKRLWLFALGAFVAGSVLCACAWNAGSLIAFRVLQGIGGGIMFPLMQTLAMQNVAQEARTRTIATLTVPVALGPIIGPVLGGLVLHWLSWRWMFLINVPVGIVGLVMAAMFIEDDRPGRETRGRPLDALGAVLIAPGLAALLYGLSQVHAAGGLGRPDVLIPGIGGALFLALFVARAVRMAGAALVDVRLLEVRSVRASAEALTFVGAALYAASFLLPLWFQTLRGYGVLDTALLLVPQGVGSLVARFVVGLLVDRFGSRRVAVMGLLITAAATVPFALADIGTSLWSLGAALLVRGLGLGLVLIPVVTAAYVDIGKDRMPDASAITRIVQQLGGAFGTAVAAVVLERASVAAGPVVGVDAAFAAAFWWTVAITVAAAAVALQLPPSVQDRTLTGPTMRR